MTNAGPQQPETKDPIDPLYWYFERERREKIGGSTSWTRDIFNNDKTKSFRIVGHVAFHSNALYLSVLVPSVATENDFLEIMSFVAGNAEEAAKAGPFGPGAPIRQFSFMKFEEFPHNDVTSDDAKFTGRVVVYTTRELSKGFVTKATASLRGLGLFVIFRDAKWIDYLTGLFGRRKIFIGHDSADKDDVVRELAHLLNGVELEVWYDEISLKPGARLRKGIDDGLEETDYFLPIVTENWMANDRYAEYEFDAIMHRMITEKSVTVIPVCVGVSPGELKKKSRVLADTVAIVHQEAESISQLARRIGNAIEPQMPHVGEPLPDVDLPKKSGMYSVGVSIGPAPDGTEENS